MFLEKGHKVTDTEKLRRHYVPTTRFKLDVISLLPTDLVYLGLGADWAVIFRLNRLLRIGRLVQVNHTAIFFLQVHVMLVSTRSLPH